MFGKYHWWQSVTFGLFAADSTVCRDNKLASHLDGAQVFNAAVKLGVDLRSITKNFDSVSILPVKGLGTPMGSSTVGLLN